ncbi:MAG: OsmC family protein [Hyphomicrobiaceae bacterium]|jgi:organic hydroperoxide reductase OsmC/OhrA
MHGREHRYGLSVHWTGNRGPGTTTYTAYGRDHVIRAPGKPDLIGSSDPAFRGDATRYNPEDLLVASLSACHMLWFLHLAADAGVIVTDYRDEPEGTMVEDRARGGYFTRVVLRPAVTVAPGIETGRLQAIHADAHKHCFIANSVNFPVDIAPTALTAPG